MRSTEGNTESKEREMMGLIRIKTAGFLDNPELGPTCPCQLPSRLPCQAAAQIIRPGTCREPPSLTSRGHTAAQGNIPKTHTRQTHNSNDKEPSRKYLLVHTVSHQAASSRVCCGLLDLHLRFADLIRYVMGLLWGFKQGPSVQIQKYTTLPILTCSIVRPIWELLHIKYICRADIITHGGCLFFFAALIFSHWHVASFVSRKFANVLSLKEN